MSNLYESEDFNIVSVYQMTPTEPNVDGVGYDIMVQRLPLEQFPQLTNVCITGKEISSDLSIEDFLSIAPSIIRNKLAEYDATFDGSEPSPMDFTNFVQVFTD